MESAAKGSGYMLVTCFGLFNTSTVQKVITEVSSAGYHPKIPSIQRHQKQPATEGLQRYQTQLRRLQPHRFRRTHLMLQLRLQFLIDHQKQQRYSYRVSWFFLSYSSERSKPEIE